MAFFFFFFCGDLTLSPIRKQSTRSLLRFFLFPRPARADSRHILHVSCAFRLLPASPLFTGMRPWV